MRWATYEDSATNLGAIKNWVQLLLKTQFFYCAHTVPRLLRFRFVCEYKNFFNSGVKNLCDVHRQL